MMRRIHDVLHISDDVAAHPLIVIYPHDEANGLANTQGEHTGSPLQDVF
jgi:hypothetical protein